MRIILDFKNIGKSYLCQEETEISLHLCQQAQNFSVEIVRSDKGEESCIQAFWNDRKKPEIFHEKKHKTKENTAKMQQKMP